MRLLVCTSELPYPPVTGTRLIVDEVVRRLAARHRITMVGYRWPEQSRARSFGESVEVHEVVAPRRSQLRRLRDWAGAARSGEPMQVHGLVAPLARALERLDGLDGIDAAHVTGPVLAQLAAHLDGVPKVLMAVDAWHLNARAQTLASPPWMRPARRLEESRIERFQARSFPAFDEVLTVADEDADALRALDPALRVGVVPNGVDAERFAPGDDAPEPGLIVFVGTMRWAPNVRAATFLATEVLPRVRRRHPHARLALIGRSMAPELRARLAAQSGVEAVGEVDDVVPWLRRGAVFACPMLDGTGIKNKVLEALACGRPTVATPLACQGMRVSDEVELLQAQGADGVAGAIGRLLDDPAAAAALGRRGREYVRREHDWGAVAERVERIYARVSASRAVAR